MRNSKHETIADVVAKMLEFAETDSQTIGRDVLRRRIQHFANRIEAAHQREVAELRECLKDAVLYNCAICDSKGKSCEVKGFCSEQRWRKALKDEGGEK